MPRDINFGYNRHIAVLCKPDDLLNIPLRIKTAICCCFLRLGLGAFAEMSRTSYAPRTNFG